MSDRKWFDVKIGSFGVYAECEDEAWEILDEIRARFPKRVDPDKPNLEFEVIDVVLGEE